MDYVIKPIAELTEAETETVIARANQIVMSGKDERSIKRALRREFGSFQVTAVIFQAWMNMHGGEGQFGDDDLADEGHICSSLMERLVSSQMNLPRWKKIAEEDPKAYRQALNRLLAAIRTVLNRYCGVESHAPRKDRERDELLMEIKRLKPDWTFAQVAREYNRRTGKEIQSNHVERIYVRCCERETVRLIRAWRPDIDLGDILKAFNVDLCRCDQRVPIEQQPMINQ
jgi:hypothetical protein